MVEKKVARADAIKLVDSRIYALKLNDIVNLVKDKGNNAVLFEKLKEILSKSEFYQENEVGETLYQILKKIEDAISALP